MAEDAHLSFTPANGGCVDAPVLARLSTWESRSRPACRFGGGSPSQHIGEIVLPLPNYASGARPHIDRRVGLCLPGRQDPLRSAGD